MLYHGWHDDDVTCNGNCRVAGLGQDVLEEGGKVPAIESGGGQISHTQVAGQHQVPSDLGNNEQHKRNL